LFLHGAGERGGDNEKQLTHGVKLFSTKANMTKFPCIVIAPQCPLDSYWSSVEIDRDTNPITWNFDYTRPSNPPLKAAIELVQKMITNKKASKKETYISGLSMGGMGTLEAVYKHPKLFAAELPICGGGDEARFNKKMAKVPFWIFHGDADNVVHVNNSREAVAKLKSLNANVTYTEYPGVNHNSWDNAFAEPEFLNWMFSKKK
jgi:predicted peptidase